MSSSKPPHTNSDGLTSAGERLRMASFPLATQYSLSNMFIPSNRL